MAIKPKKTRNKAPKIAVILESSHEVSRAMIRGIFKFARIHGDWRIEIAAGGPGDLRLPNRQIWRGDGIIGRLPNATVVQQIVDSRLPFVGVDPPDWCLNTEHPLAACPGVRCNSKAVGIRAAEYLMNLGFDHYAFVGVLEDTNWSRVRREFFVRTLADANFHCHIYCPPSQKNSRQEYPMPNLPDNDLFLVKERRKLTEWLKKLPKPIALFAANDHRARIVLEACADAGIHAPYEIAVLGVNNDELICQTTFPSLSSIALSAEEAGYVAANMMSDLLTGSLSRNSGKTHIFDPQNIVERGSTLSVSVTNPKLIQAIEFIRLNAGLNMQVVDVAKHIGVTRQWAERLFQSEWNCSVHEEISKVRLRTIRSMVADTEMTFGEIAQTCGFESANHLRNLFKKEYGTTMADYRLDAKRQASLPPILTPGE
ncbi:MAG: substrate-binding domain-containing protein [Planctomycetia bacterium]|nr:substrate-binding domain-containing protein [Planctomycetia bacterium]